MDEEKKKNKVKKGKREIACPEVLACSFRVLSIGHLNDANRHRLDRSDRDEESFGARRVTASREMRAVVVVFLLVRLDDCLE